MSPRLPLLAGGLLLASAQAATAPAPDSVPWRSYEEPAFPRELLMTLVMDGFAQIAFSFDATGRIDDCIVLEASHPAFATAVVEATKKWSVNVSKGDPYNRREIVRFNFQRHEVVISRTQRDAAKAALNPSGERPAIVPHTFQEEDLDEMLEPLKAVAPVYPPALKKEQIEGRASVSFVIDALGGVHVPAVTFATEPEFAEAALAAIRQWQFPVPRRDGRPVQVITGRVFRFDAAEGNPDLR
jgi:TonB family protein